MTETPGPPDPAPRQPECGSERPRSRHPAVGVAAVGCTAILAGGDTVLADLIASASLLTQVFTWLLPMLVGFVPLARWRRARAVATAS